jgi:dephospho-CoA kinase
MIILGLTGSIGMGKSAVSAMFQREGVPVFDADAAVHQLQGPGGALVGAIEQRFPGTTGLLGVDRQKLGARVFGKADELKALERLIHPAVAKLRQQWLKRNRARRIVVLDIPLLFEKRGWRAVDMTVVVSAPVWMQRRRVLARRDMTPLKFRRIKALQTPDHIKRRRADVVIETGRLKSETQRSVHHLVACIQARRSG